MLRPLLYLALTKIDISPLPNVTADQSKLQTVLTIVFSITGALALLMITIGGMRYIASQGDPQQLSKAKGTIIYALVGLLVSITAIGIVTFVLGRL
jgi:hypothetical protein